MIDPAHTGHRFWRMAFALAAYLLAAGVITSVILGLPSGVGAQGRLTPPPEPLVKPEIPRLADLDRDGNRIDDRLDIRLRTLQALQFRERDAQVRQGVIGVLMEPIRVELVFSRRVTQQQIDTFLAMGGRIDYMYRAVGYGWNGRIPLQRIPWLPQRMGAGLLGVVGESPIRWHLDEATRTGRVRPVWASGFAGGASGFSGNSSITIGILDSGIDDSHTDLSGRMEYWKDYSPDNEASPRDETEHGTHVAGIALGSGASLGTGTTLLYTDSADLTGAPSSAFYPSPMHLPNTSLTFTSTASWLGGGSTTLYQVYRDNGSSGSYTGFGTSGSGTSPRSVSTTFTPLTTRNYTTALVQNSTGTVGLFSIQNTVTNYPAIGDGFNTLRGVAPLCRWAGGKVFRNDGSGNDLDMGAAVDDMVVQRISHNIKVVNMSLGIIGSPGISTTLRAKVNSAVNNGIVVVCSVGNDGPSGVASDPGRAGKVLTVAASSDINQLTDYSSIGFTSPDATEDNKPDVVAPGGSMLQSFILSADSNDSDAGSTGLADARANDYTNFMGTSMAAPFVAGCAALVIDALQQSGTVWNFTSNQHSLLVKMLLCMTATETNTNREGNTNNPTLGRATTPKDRFEGYGIINPDAAIEAVMLTWNLVDTLSDTTAGGRFDRRCWARKVNLTSGVAITLLLDVPATADYDLYLYSATPDSNGNPQILAASASAGTGVDESISMTPSSTGPAYVVIKRVSGSGAWTMQTPAFWTGLVTDRNGLPLNGATVRFYGITQQTFLSTTATTGADGTFSVPLSSIPNDRYHVGAYLAGRNNWLYSPGFAGYDKTGSTTSLYTELSLELTGASGGIYGNAWVTDSGGTAPLGSGVHIDVYNGGQLIASADTNSSGFYSISGLPTISPNGIMPWWGFHTLIASWNDAGTPRKAAVVNFGVWPGVSLRVDVVFRRP